MMNSIAENLYGKEFCDEMKKTQKQFPGIDNLSELVIKTENAKSSNKTK